jgi:hypothetical protein
MASNTTIEIQVLRKIINGILDFIEKDVGVNRVDLTKDHYWNVLDGDVYEITKPVELGAGSLRDDWEFLLASASDKDQQLPIMLIHVAPILHALSQTVQSYKDRSEMR